MKTKVFSKRQRIPVLDAERILGGEAAPVSVQAAKITSQPDFNVAAIVEAGRMSLARGKFASARVIQEHDVVIHPDHGMLFRRTVERLV